MRQLCDYLHRLSQCPTHLSNSVKMSRRSHSCIRTEYREGHLGGLASSGEALKRFGGGNLLTTEREIRVLSRPGCSHVALGNH